MSFDSKYAVPPPLARCPPPQSCGLGVATRTNVVVDMGWGRRWRCQGGGRWLRRGLDGLLTMRTHPLHWLSVLCRCWSRPAFQLSSVARWLSRPVDLRCCRRVGGRLPDPVAVSPPTFAPRADRRRLNFAAVLLLPLTPGPPRFCARASVNSCRSTGCF